MATSGVFGFFTLIDGKADRMIMASKLLNQRINDIRSSRLTKKKMMKRAKCVWTKIGDIHIHNSNRCIRRCRKFYEHKIYPQDNYGYYIRDYTGRYIMPLNKINQFSIYGGYDYKSIKLGLYVITHHQSHKIKLITIKLLKRNFDFGHSLMLMCRREINQILEKHHPFSLFQKMLFKISRMVLMVFMTKNLTKLSIYY